MPHPISQDLQIAYMRDYITQRDIQIRQRDIQIEQYNIQLRQIKESTKIIEKETEKTLERTRILLEKRDEFRDEFIVALKAQEERKWFFRGDKADLTESDLIYFEKCWEKDRLQDYLNMSLPELEETLQRHTAWNDLQEEIENSIGERIIRFFQEVIIPIYNRYLKWRYPSEINTNIDEPIDNSYQNPLLPYQYNISEHLGDEIQNHDNFVNTLMEEETSEALKMSF